MFLLLSRAWNILGIVEYLVDKTGYSWVRDGYVVEGSEYSKVLEGTFCWPHGQVSKFPFRNGGVTIMKRK